MSEQTKTYALLGIGAKAWAELEQIERDGVRFRCSDSSGMSISWGTFRLVMDVLRDRQALSASGAGEDRSETTKTTKT